MEFIKIFIIFEFIFLVFQFIKPLKLESLQYAELAFGSFLIILFFGLFGYILTAEFTNPNSNALNNSAFLATCFAVWYYITKKLTNLINSDSNGVIYY